MAADLIPEPSNHAALYWAPRDAEELPVMVVRDDTVAELNGDPEQHWFTPNDVFTEPMTWETLVDELAASGCELAEAVVLLPGGVERIGDHEREAAGYCRRCGRGSTTASSSGRRPAVAELVEVEAPVRLLVDSRWHHLPAQLIYLPMDPFAVTLLVQPAPDVEVVWVLARDLLAEGMQRRRTQPAGCGDVQIWQRRSGGRRVLVLRLCGDDGEVQLQLDRSTVGEFLRRSYRQVPRGSERMDWDWVIRRLLEPQWKGE